MGYDTRKMMAAEIERLYARVLELETADWKFKLERYRLLDENRILRANMPKSVMRRLIIQGAIRGEERSEGKKEATEEDTPEESQARQSVDPHVPLWYRDVSDQLGIPDGERED